jgi:holliday junction DNA helicase RuvA
VYEFLQGQVIELGLGHVVLEAGCVGYVLQISHQTSAKVSLHDQARLLVHFHVTETSQSLFGFASPAERSLFRRLLQVNGIGPTSALGLLSSMPPESLARCILDGDHKALTTIKGVGKKTAERLVVELRDHLGELAAPAAGQSATQEPSGELEQVLIGLGFSQRDAGLAAQTARDSLGPESPFQDLLRQALHVHHS